MKNEEEEEEVFDRMNEEFESRCRQESEKIDRLQDISS